MYNFFFVPNDPVSHGKSYSLPFYFNRAHIAFGNITSLFSFWSRTNILLFIIWKTLADNRASGSYLYEVLQKDNKAHMVKINNSPRQGETQYGYVFFDKSVRPLGPVRRVTKVKLVMVWSSLDRRKNSVGLTRLTERTKFVPLQKGISLVFFS